MRIQILYDNQSINTDFKCGWGFSCLIDGTTLFDTGEKFAPLQANARQLDVALSHIERVIISHDHWDHTGGLWELLKHKPGIPVFCCPGFGSTFKKNVAKYGGKLVEAAEKTLIFGNLYSTGEIMGTHKNRPIAEQGLVIQRGDRAILMTGCAHPGIISIINETKNRFDGMLIDTCIGGFHFMDKKDEEIRIVAEEMVNAGIRRGGPTHCSGETARIVFKEIFKEQYISLGSGKTVAF